MLVKQLSTNYPAAPAWYVDGELILLCCHYFMYMMQDLAPFNIRVNVVNPGVVETPLQKRGGMTDDSYTAFLDRSIKVTHPLGMNSSVSQLLLGACSLYSFHS